MVMVVEADMEVEVGVGMEEVEGMEVEVVGDGH